MAGERKRSDAMPLFRLCAAISALPFVTSFHFVDHLYQSRTDNFGLSTAYKVNMIAVDRLERLLLMRSGTWLRRS